MLLGCGSSNETSPLEPYKEYISHDAVTYDYYEIANGSILHTEINTDVVNVTRVYNYLQGNEHLVEHTEFVDNYNIVNTPLSIDEVADVYKESYLNTITDSSYTRTYKKSYGLYEIKTNYCIINSNVSGCETYIYTNKI